MLKNIKQNARIVDTFIKKYFNTQKYSELIPVMKYGTLFGGKKIRSTIILNTSKIFNIKYIGDIHILKNFVLFK